MYDRQYKITGGLYDSFKDYKKSSKKNISKTKYCNVCHEFNKALSQKIIKESFEFKIPFGLGYLRIKASKPKLKFKNGKPQIHKMAINWKETLNLWERMYGDKSKAEYKKIPDKKLVVHTNEHTDGYVMKWYWDRRISNVKNQTVYMFKPVKGGISLDNYYYGRLGLAKWIMSDDRINEYYS